MYVFIAFRGSRIVVRSSYNLDGLSVLGRERGRDYAAAYYAAAYALGPCIRGVPLPAGGSARVRSRDDITPDPFLKSGDNSQAFPTNRLPKLSDPTQTYSPQSKPKPTNVGKNGPLRVPESKKDTRKSLPPARRPGNVDLCPAGFARIQCSS